MTKNSSRCWLVGVLALVSPSCEGPPEVDSEPFQGVVEYRDTQVGFEVGGRVVELMADAGEDITKGAALARLDDGVERAAHSTRASEVEAALAQAELVKAGPRREEVAAAAARLRAAQAEVEMLKRELDRESRLLAERVTPQKVVDDLRSTLDSARAQRDALAQELSRLRRGSRQQEISTAEARARASAGALRAADERLELYSISSPLDGRVLERHVEVGEVVAPTAPVFTLADDKRPYTDIFVPQQRIGEVRVGAKALVRIDALDVPIAGRVESIARETEFTPRFLFSERERPNLVIRVRIDISDPQRHLYAGVPAFVTVAAADDNQPGKE